jgi:recombination protein RecA
MAKKKNFLDEVVEEYGEDVVGHSELSSVIPTSSEALNVSTGVGGIPKGRFTHIYGPESSGKTSVGLDIAKNTLMYGGKVLYLDVEQTLDRDLATRIVGNYAEDDNFIVIMPDSAENAFEIAEKAIKSGDFDCIIFDSIGALAPEKELEDSFGDPHVSLVARLLTTFFKRNAFIVRKNDIAFIFLNQVRASIGNFFKEFEMPGGWALKHYSSIMMFLIPLTAEKNRIKIKKENGDEKFIGNLVKFSITKNKVGVPYRSGTIPIIWGYGVDPVRDVLDFAGNLGVVQSRGPYKVFQEDTLGLGIEKTLTFLEENPDVLDKIVKECYHVSEVTAKPYLKEEGDDGETEKNN